MLFNVILLCNFFCIAFLNNITSYLFNNKSDIIINYYLNLV